MFIRGKRVGTLTAEDIAQLLIDGVPESVILEYKRDLPGGTDEERKEFLADVSALANTAGGVILFGIDEERDSDNRPTGIPKDPVYGVTIPNEDALKRDVSARILDGLNPRLLPHVEMQSVQVAGRTVFAIGIARSLNAPHAVWFKKNGRFFRRNASGKYQVDPQELKRMFLEYAEWGNDAEAFRRDRIAKIRDRHVLLNLDVARLTVMHILPLGRLKERVDIFSAGRENMPHRYLPEQGLGAALDFHPNFDGFIVFDVSSKPLSTGFVQLLGCGGIEFCTTKLHWEDKGAIVYNTPGLFHCIRNYIPSMTQRMKSDWQLQPPFAALVTVLNVQNLRSLRFEYGMQVASAEVFQQPDLYFPPTILSEDPVTEGDLKPLTNSVLQASGLPPEL